jgi:hypothetical protein
MQKKNVLKNSRSGACRKKYEVFLYNKCKIFIITSRGAGADEDKRKTLENIILPINLTRKKGACFSRKAPSKTIFFKAAISLFYRPHG